MTALAKVSNGTSLPMLSNWIEDWFGRDFSPLMGRDVSFNVPAVNIKETADDFLIELAVPGKKKSDFQIELDNNLLSISSETQTENEDTTKGFSRKEFNYSSFKRTFNLPESVNRDKISAKYIDGILMLTLPKLDEAKQKPPRSITIK